MQNQYIQHGSATPSINLKFIVPSTGLSCTTLTNATAGLTLAYSRPGAANVNIALAAQTVTGAWTAGGFVHRGDGVYRLDLPAAAVLTGVIQLTLLAALLPADVALVATVVALGPDDLGVAAPTQAGIASASATAVDGALADNFAALATLIGNVPGLVWAVSVREVTTISAGIREAIADSFLGRTVTGGANGGRTVARFFLKGVARWLLSGTNNNTYTQYGVDDTTPAFTETLTRDSNGSVIGSDPT